MTCVILQWVMWVALLYIFGFNGWGPNPAPGTWRYGAWIIFFLLLLLGVLCLLGIGGSTPALHKIGEVVTSCCSSS